MLELAEAGTYTTLYMVADAHTITTPFDPQALAINRKEVILDYLAAGLNPDTSTLFFQADVPEHLELAFYFSSVVSIARMQHLPTFKDKIRQHPDNATMALLNYPVLMAADILLYKAALVPVGIDQEPHLEITREIARKLNQLYGLDFPEPVRFATRGQYVPSLKGEGKMSKTIEGSFIELQDDLKTIQKRLAGAPTDSGRGASLPSSGGVANLLTLVELFEGVAKRKEYQERYTSTGISYKELKHDLALAIDATLEPIRQRRAEFAAKPKYVDQVRRQGAESARVLALQTMAEVRDAFGLGQ